MKAIIELQKRAMDSSTDIVELIRYAYVIAYKLGLQDFVDWCDAELKGYSRGSVIPDYRVVRGVVEVQRFDGLIQPLQFSDLVCREKISKMPISNDITYLANVLKGSKSDVSLIYRSEIEQHLRECIGNDSYYISQIYLRVMAAEFKNIFSVITKNILDWALECEKQGILGEGLEFTKEEKAMAQNITYNIGSVQNMASHNMDSMINQTVQSMSIIKGDFQSLANFLNDKGISKSDIQDLKEIIDVEPNLATEGIGNNKVQGWIGKIATKMANGTIAVASRCYC